MTALPASTERRLGLVIDLDTCVGCQACAVACKQWNDTGVAAPLSDVDPYGPEASGTWLNRVHSFEADDGKGGFTLHFPRSCLHCDNAPCVTVCPTGASYKRRADGIVLVDEDLCIGCGLCAWACPYGARELDEASGVMKKCTLCADRLDNPHLAAEDRIPACVRTCPTGARHYGDLADPASEVSLLVAARGGVALMPESGCAPTNRYLPPRERRSTTAGQPGATAPAAAPQGFLGWLDRMLAG